ncbi:MAG: hypothetical protein HY067_22705 [Betaproteobacteria bacterium]|nr:hypothetical protein [Betaproteobacteria bacterium]
MSQEEELPVPIVPQASSLEARILQEVFEVDIENAQPLIARHLEELGPDKKGSQIEMILQATWNHVEGYRLIRQEGNFALAAEVENSAAVVFEEFGITDMESLCRSLAAYSMAILEAQRSNISRCLELFQTTEEYLRKAGRYRQKFQPIIDHMKPEALFVGAMQAVMAQDLGAARTLVESASEASRTVAEKYHEKESPSYFTFLGLANIYRAFFIYIQAERDIATLNLDRLAEPTIAAPAREAERLLAKADLASVQIRATYQLSKALIELTEVTQSVAAHMNLCFKAAFKPDLRGFVELKAKVHLATEHVSKAGPQAVVLSRLCDALLARIQNLERLARPKRADFGIYSGLISCALFVPLVLIASWASKNFGIVFDGKILLPTVVALSLIGGFGFGAVRFRTFLFSRPESTKSVAKKDA